MESKSHLYTVNIDSDQALHLVQHGAALLILDAPESFFFGFDLQMFATGPKFKGLKMIPPGTHFVYYCAKNRHGNDTSPVTGFFIKPSLGEIIVQRWDAKEERLRSIPDSSEEQCYRIAVKNMEFDSQLGAYDIHRYQVWKQLTSYISSTVIDRLEPVGGDISVSAEAEFGDQQPKTLAERQFLEKLKTKSSARDTQESNASTGGKKTSSGRCFYTPIPHLIKCSGVSGAELTMLNVDKSTILESLLKDEYGGQEDLLLGELQFSFVGFLMGQSLESFIQWKAILGLMLSCQDAPLRLHTQLFIKFLKVVCVQLKTSLASDNYTGGDFPLLDNSWFLEDNFLRLLWKEFYIMVKDAQPVDGELLKQVKRLKALLESLLGWSLDDKAADNPYAIDEYAPVVVDAEPTELT